MRISIAAVGPGPLVLTPAQRYLPQKVSLSYQRLREHLAYLRLPDAAAALPSVLDDARTQAWSATATLERLLAAEVDATEAPGARNGC